MTHGSFKAKVSLLSVHPDGAQWSLLHPKWVSVSTIHLYTDELNVQTVSCIICPVCEATPFGSLSLLSFPSRQEMLKAGVGFSSASDITSIYGSTSSFSLWARSTQFYGFKLHFRPPSDNEIYTAGQKHKNI